MITNVTKASGKKELFDADKINKVVDWACEDFPEVSPSEICMNANISLYEGIPTDIIHETLVKSAADLISEEEPDYQIPAGRLLMLKLRKEAYGTHNPPSLLDHVKEMISLGWYSQEILEFYTEDEVNYFDEHINHELDFNFPYVAARAFQDKYLVSVKKTGMVLETPQTAYMLVGMMLHCNEKVDRKTHVLNFYKAVSNGELSLPTPIIAGVRTPVKQYSSCVLIEAGDDIHQIFNANTAQAFYTAQRAGIGVNIGMLRGEGAPVRGGSTIHSGVVPIARMLQESLNWPSQGGIRKGSANYFYPMWHYDYENIVVLKNNRGTEETRARHVDHTIQMNELMYKRLVEGGNITLFDPNVADGKLYQYFFESNNKFEKLYTSLEKDPNIRKKSIPAIEAWKMFVAERSQTGRIYLMNVDNVNEGGSFDQNQVVIKQSNLCVEIALPTEPMNNIYEGDGLVSTCTLAAINLGKVFNHEDILRVARIAVRALDNLIDYQEYPVKAAEKGKDWRNLGIGVINYAYHLAKNMTPYGSGYAKNLTHSLFEDIQFCLIQASNELAKEKGTAKEYGKTKYSKGMLPIDWYKKEVDTVHTAQLKQDWEWLRKEVKEYGLRNCTLSAIMPSESSSQVNNATNGIEPPRSVLSYKSSKSGTVPQIIPDARQLKPFYTFKWDMKDCVGYLETCAIFQKFTDQSISTNTMYKPHDFPESKLPLEVVLQHIFYARKLGIKTLYYHETNDGNKQSEDKLLPTLPSSTVSGAGCESGACEI